MPLPLLAIAGGVAAGSLLGGLFGNRRGKEETNAAKRLRMATDSEQGRSGQLTGQSDYMRGQYLDRLQKFDAHEALAGETEAVGADITEDFNASQLQRRQGLNNRGFYGANLGTGHLNREVASRIGRESARLSTRAAEMDQRNTDRFGDMYGMDVNREEGSRDRYLDLLSGGRDYEMGRRQERSNIYTGAFGAGARTYAAGAGGRAG